MSVERVLIASRGEVARRLIRQYRDLGAETVAVFSRPDLEQPWVEEADYAAYLNGTTVEETYLDGRKMVSAAMDAGCDAVHPGYGRLAERLDFVQMAATANLPVIGADAKAVSRAADRFQVRQVARHLGIPLVPASDPLPEGDDGVAAGAQLGFPLYVKAVAGGTVVRVASQEMLPKAVALARETARLRTGEEGVYLERALEGHRRVGTVVVGDRMGSVYHLGEADGSLQLGYRSWIEEMGTAVAGDLHDRLGAAAVELAEALEWVGVGRVRWALTAEGGWYLLGFSARLTTGYTLYEQVHGIDLVQAQLHVQLGEPLAWTQLDAEPERHGVQLRVLHVDARDGLSRPPGEIERMVLPDGVLAETGTAEGQPITEDSDPLLVKLTITGPTRHAALVRARAALDELVIEGVPTNRDVLRGLLGDETIWRGGYDVQTLEGRLAH